MALDSLSANLRIQMQWDVTKNMSGLQPRKSTDTLVKAFAYTTGTGAGAGNEMYVAYRTLAASASETIDFATALTNLVGDTSVALARIKALLIWLLAATDTVGVSGSGQVTGTACSSITVGNAAATQFVGFFGAATHTLTIPNGGQFAIADPGATGWLCTNGSLDNFKVLNNDAGVAANYIIGLIGAAT